MNQLEKRFYDRKEIAQITGVKLADDKHFKRNVESVLTKWGYGYDWMRNGVAITHVPDLPEERLQEILIRQFQVDIQVDMYSFACFVTAFNDVPGFDSMPWKVREEEFREFSGRFYTSRTLSHWCKKLIEQGIMCKGSEGSYWKTYEDARGLKKRELVTEEEAQAYFRERYALIEDITWQIMKGSRKLSYDEARSEAWKNVVNFLWDRDHCCYYSCKTFHFTAWNLNGSLADVYELTRYISGKEDRYE